jgi:ribosomal protein L12E/L44/L45/RPP1/RPP2
MKLSTANTARARYINLIMAYLAEQGEDVALVTSNTCNLPFVEDDEEGVLEVVVKVVKKDYDECMQERADYIAKCTEQAEKKAEREKAAAEKKAKAEAKKKEKAAE